MTVNHTIKLLTVAPVLLAVLVFLLGCRPKTVEERPLKDLLAELTPGMTVTQVMAVMPGRFLLGRERATNVMWQTFLVPKNAKTEWALRYMRSPSDWRPLGSMEYVYLYLNSNDCLVGIYYTSRRYSFDISRSPAWRSGGVVQ